jgi:hypothetical protein
VTINFKKFDSLYCSNIQCWISPTLGSYFSWKKNSLHPLIGQPEQENNADTLKKLNHATICKEFTKSDIEHWIQHGKAKKELYNDTMDLMIDMIHNPKKDFSKKIFEAWNQPS